MSRDTEQPDAAKKIRASMIGNQNAAKPEEEKANTNIHTRVTPTQKSTWQAMAEAEGIPFSKWLIGCVEYAIKHKKKMK